ncbi:Uncharacterised protein [Mesomycoplasma conjunctivae]|uniref:PUTATIVE TRANSPOSASE FOR INSERTION SEQUENCE ELEMENT IS1 n=1 Tax=Mesomycoplasma conjunctivae (strain ATCC 25834 / NCTC 10147 / HRC/581) TaxID=572263 RepID=C5J604_MESCH|nr:IS3 family transposase [Mesomycoplasma conjunctivae]CAT04896.1 PUTATIVE TRANSPOSASE FOR INSERTION SEQUENCE ELEMENT IS1 [Mesomycoplasma conjunctivae]VEU66004.1 Uncharacterised protein [Mesomycoplasma conjunctivae]
MLDIVKRDYNDKLNRNIFATDVLYIKPPRIIKSECLNELDYSKITLEDLKKIIADYIFWYNNYRIQSILNWKTPQQYAMMLK